MYKRMLFVIVLVMLLVGMTGIISGESPMLPSAKDPAVDSTAGEWYDTYNYSVDVLFDKEIDVELRVWDPLFGYWTTQGTAHYGDIRKWERIYWNDTQPFSEAFEGTISRFMFRWGEENLLERKNDQFVPLMGPGPRIGIPPPEVKFKNGNVSKVNATYRDKLDYNISVNASIAVDIELRIYDPCLGIWKSMAVKTASRGKWEELSWGEVTPFSETNCKSGRSQFLFRAYYKGKLINNTKTYPGPNLIPLIEFRNPKVEPGSGKYNTSFHYSVEIANVSDQVNPTEIKLEVLNPYTSTWTPYNQTDAPNNTLIWGFKPFKSDKACQGTALYRFTYGDERWPEVLPRYGPQITPIDGPDNPNTISLSGCLVSSTTAECGNSDIEYYVHTGYVTPFNFTVQSNSSVDLELLIRDPVTERLERKGGLQHCDPGRNARWNYIKPFDSINEDEIVDYIGKRFNYTFSYGGNLYEEDFAGPELMVAFKDPKCPSAVIYREKFNYCVEVIANKTLTVTLQYNKGSAWVPVGERRYTDGKEWERLTWDCIATEQWKEVRFKWW
jgi:hypothetical protein